MLAAGGLFLAADAAAHEKSASSFFCACWDHFLPRRACLCDHAAEKNLKKNSAEKGRVRDSGSLTGKRDSANLVNLACLVHLASVVQLLDISRFMWYNIGRGEEL